MNPSSTENHDRQNRNRLISWSDPTQLAREGIGMTGLQYLQAIHRGEIEAPPFAKLIGFELHSCEAGKVVFKVTPAEFHYNPLGVVHGGLAATLLDSAMGCAVQSLLPAATWNTTLELKINYVRPLTSETGEVFAVGKVLHLGRRTALAEARITNREDKLLGHGSSTCMILREEEA